MLSPEFALNANVKNNCSTSYAVIDVIRCLIISGDINRASVEIYSRYISLLTKMLCKFRYLSRNNVPKNVRIKHYFVFPTTK